ncbi:MAG: metalloregulator ArsR/SmtB family transcription factor [Thermoanaerobaculia bacterium]
MVTHNSNHHPPFRALADPTRRDILVLLGKGPLSVGEIALEFPVSRPAISKHLRILEQAQLVSEVREGRRHLYRVDPGPLAEVRSWLDLFRPPESRPLEETKVPRVRRAALRVKKVPVGAVEDGWKQW